MLSNTQKEVMSEDMITLIEGGFMSECGQLTDSAKGYISYLNFQTHKEALLERAKAKIAEAKKANAEA